MKHRDLVSLVARKAGITRKDAESLLQNTFEEIAGALEEGEPVQTNLGTFYVSGRRNERKDDPRALGTSRQVRFRASPALKNRVNDNDS